MTESGLIIAEVVFLVLLYLFIWAVVRSSMKALRAAEVEATPPPRKAAPPQAAPPAAAPATGRGVPPSPAVATVAAEARTVPAVRGRGGRSAGPAVLEPEPPPPARLVVVRSTSLEPGMVMTMDGGITVGRSKSNQLAVNDQFISHTHARLFRRGQAHFVEDLGSLNGTFVNGRRVKKEAQLHVGDEVRLGETVLRFEG